MMNWYLMSLLGFFGIVMGLLSLQGLTQKIELYLWIILGFFAALVVARNVPSGWFWHVFLVGISWGILNAMLQCIFFDIYAANNPAVVEGFGGNPAPIPPRYFFLILGPFIGAATGLAMCGLTFVLRTFIV